MTNEELAEKIQAGEETLIPKLWEQVSRFAFWKCERVSYFIRGKTIADLEDLQQESYIAFLTAIRAYDPQKANFISLFNYCIMTAFAVSTGTRTAKSRGEPLNNSISLYTPISHDEDDGCLLELIEDSSIPDFSWLLYLRELKSAVASCLEQLKPEHRQIVQMIYLDGMDETEAAAVLGVPTSEAKKIEKAALKALRTPQICNLLRPFYLAD